MSAVPEHACSRTGAVLALHLDGDLDGGCGEATARDPLGYGFVSEDSLHEHLVGCARCQQALLRARRLDAALASGAGRLVADHAAATGANVSELCDRLLGRAAVAASASPDADELSSGDGLSSDGLQGDHLLSGTTPPGRTPTGGSPAEPAAASRLATWLAAASVIAAGLATWLCLRPEPAARTFSEDPGAPNDVVPQSVVPQSVVASDVDEPDLAAPDLAAPEVETDESPDTGLPRGLARSLHDARGRELPEQRTASKHELGRRVSDRDLDAPARLAAAQRLLQATGPGSTGARLATDALLAALAACGDETQHERALHEELLESARRSNTFVTELERGLQPSTANTPSTPDARELAALVVAARVGGDRLDGAVRRAVRRRPELSATLAQALRCRVRVTGTAALLLACWHDQAAVGRQQDSARWATFWFAGQTPETFDELPRLLVTLRTSPERVRCLLAMGCVTDDSTLATLLTGLRSPRRLEACAAACGLSLLPHRVLTKLLPRAKRSDQGLLRAALARADLPPTRGWVRRMGLTHVQVRLLREGPLTRFPEAAAWFRERPPVGD